MPTAYVRQIVQRHGNGFARAFFAHAVATAYFTTFSALADAAAINIILIEICNKRGLRISVAESFSPRPEKTVRSAPLFPGGCGAGDPAG